MTTVVNNPSPSSGSGMGMGMIVGVVIVILVIVLLVMFGMPYLRGGGTSAPAENSAPQGNTINVPDEIDINVNPGQY